MAINFNQVGFTYQLNTPFATPGLHDVNFTMPEGKFTAVIGPTGSNEVDHGATLRRLGNSNGW